MGGRRVVTDEPPTKTDLVKATEAALADAYASGILTGADQAAVQALRDLAVKLAVQDVYFDELAKRAREVNGRPPAQDNVSMPTFLKYCEALGLTPSSRAALARAAAAPAPDASKGKEGGGGVSKLKLLQNQGQGKAG